MERKTTSKEIEEIERELCEQSHRIVFGEKHVRVAVNPQHSYVG